MRVSACIMAKDEEESLPRCLKSVKWVDEIVLVDTGSRDRTVEIAEEFGAKIYHHPWQNDFSFHRNQTISKATGDWILIIDADEEIVSDMSSIKERLSMLPEEVSALVVTVTEISGDRPTTSWIGMRFFKRMSGIHYKNAVHNKAVFEGTTAATDIQMHHYGYSLDPEKMEKKRARTEALLLERLSKDPDDHAAMYYMCQMRIGQKRYKEAKEFGLDFFHKVPCGPESMQFYGVMYFYMSWSCLHLKDGEGAYAWANHGLKFYPEDVDLNYMMARIGYMAKRDDWLKEHGEKYLALLPKVRKRGVEEATSFETRINHEDWFNRTVYTADSAAETDVRKFMEALSDQGQR